MSKFNEFYSYKYTPILVCLSSMFTIYCYGDHISRFVEITKNFILKNKEAKTINHLTENKMLDKITTAWIKMENNGGLETVLASKKLMIKQCTEKANINELRAKELVSCLRKSISSSDNTKNKIIKFVECSHITPMEAVTDINKAIVLGNCLEDVFNT